MLVDKTPRREELFWNKVDKTPGQGREGDCWCWTSGVNENGYGFIDISIDGKQRRFYAHRISYEWEYGSIPEGKIVRHKCDNPPCVNPAHLLSGSHQDNTNDKMERGRYVSALAKISKKDVFDIRMARHFGASAKDIAVHYKLTPQHISNICTGVYWPDAGGPLTKRFELPDDIIRQVLEDVKTMNHSEAAIKNGISKSAVQTIASGKRKPRGIES